MRGGRRGCRRGCGVDVALLRGRERFGLPAGLLLGDELRNLTVDLRQQILLLRVGRFNSGLGRADLRLLVPGVGLGLLGGGLLVVQRALGAAQLLHQVDVVLGGRLRVLRAGDQPRRARDVEVDGTALPYAAVQGRGPLLDLLAELRDPGLGRVVLLLGVVRRRLRLLEAVLRAVVSLGQRVELGAVGVDLVLERLRLSLLVVDGVCVGAAARDQRDERDDERERGEPPCVPGAERADGSVRRGRCG